MKNHFKIILPFCLLSFVVLLIWPARTEAARLYLKLNQKEYNLEDVFLAEIRLDSEGEYINAVEVNLTFPSDILEVRDFSAGNSILTLWVKEPVFSNEDGTLSFSGGIPGGYQGIKDALGRIVFAAKGSGQTQIRFGETSQALLNDGLGTQANLARSGVDLNILDSRLDETIDEWANVVGIDDIPPERFGLEIGQDSSILEGKYFITFSTTDKQSGVDYYEIAEMNLIERFLKKAKWQRATSPYILQDQSLKSLIKVKAVDKSGNSRIEIFKPEFKVSVFDIIWIILITLAFGTIFWLIKIRKYKK